MNAVIGPGYAVLMARYNRWRNEATFSAADTLNEDERRADTGAFFGSIHETLNHILWADRLWLSRLASHPPPEATDFEASRRLFEDWRRLGRERADTDRFFERWAHNLRESDLSGDLSWRSAAQGREISVSRVQIIIHVFNHQTHHRGQVHAMLTAAGAASGDTDLVFMPDHFDPE